jgi:hypothetical protein
MLASLDTLMRRSSKQGLKPRGRFLSGVRHPANTIEDMKKLLLGYRDNMKVEIESDIAVTAKTVADLRALPTWPEGLVLDIHVDLDPRLSVVRVERAS